MPTAKDTWHICWHEYFVYDETSPTFLRWAINIPYHNSNKLKVRCGDVAGSISHGRANIKVNQQRYPVSRVVHEMKVGPLHPTKLVDHYDGNSLNNNFKNLRAVTPFVNSHNMAISKRNKSGIKGVVKNAVLDRNRVTWWYYWTAGWMDSGKYRSKSFSVYKLGEEGAFNSACEYRYKKLQELNEQGAGYTERHFYDENGTYY